MIKLERKLVIWSVGLEVAKGHPAEYYSLEGRLNPQNLHYSANPTKGGQYGIPWKLGTSNKQTSSPIMMVAMDEL